MRKKSSSRIHVSKVESARDISSSRQVLSNFMDFRQKEMPKASTARPNFQNFIPPLKLQSKAISKLEKTSRPESATLRFLTEPSKYSDPNSITTFIQINSISQQDNDSAIKIQRAWRRSQSNKKTFYFIHIVFKLYTKKAKFPMRLWLLARRFPASIAKIHYDKIVSFMIKRHYLIFHDHHWYTVNFNSYLLSFDQYCKTNGLLIGKEYDISKIIKFVKIMMRPLMKETLKIWQETSETSHMLPKQDPLIRATHEYRSNFHELFWTFVFWRRWTVFRKSRNIEKATSTCSSFYLLEWNIYKAKKIQKRNIIHKAFCMRDNRLKHYSFVTMRNYCLLKIKLRNEFNKIQKVGNYHSMSLCFRSFLFNHVQCSIEKSLKYRVLSSWYKVTDKSMINDACLSAIKSRANIKLMIKTMSRWKDGIYDNCLNSLFLFDWISRNQLFALKVAFLLMKDFVHFTFVSSFAFWKEIMWMKKRAKMFAYWSFKQSKEDSIKCYLLDLFRENCLHQVDFLNYFPFKSEQEKKFTSIGKSDSDRAPLSLKKKKSKLIKLVQNMSHEGLVMKSFTSTVDQTVHSYQKVDEFPIFEGTNATSEQIKTLFYHVVILKAYLNKGKFKNNIDETSSETISMKERQIKEFRKTNNLLTMSSLRKYRKKQEEKFEAKRKLMIQKLQRDSLLLAKKDVYLALVALNKVNPQFTIEPKKTFKESPIIGEKEIIQHSSSSSSTVILNEKENVDKDIESTKFSRKQKHPLLNPIPTLKDGITKSNRKARRPPKQLFTEETNQSVHNRSIRISPEPGMKKNHSKQNESPIIYEKHQNLSKVSKEKYFQDKKRIEKEQLKNMPPPVDQMPTIKNALPLRNRHKDNHIQLSSHLEVSNDSLNKFMSSQNLDLSRTFTSTSPLIRKNGEDEEEEEDEFEFIDEGEKEINQMISQIEKISFPYINNDKYLNQTSIERRDHLANKYFSILDILLSKKKKKKPTIPQLQSPSQTSSLYWKNKNENEEEDHDEEDEEEEEEMSLPQNCVSRVLKALMPSRQQQHQKGRKKHRKKQNDSPWSKKRRPLFYDRSKPFEKVVGKDGVVYSKSSDPQFSSVLFLGDHFMSKLNLSGKLPESLIEKYMKPKTIIHKKKTAKTAEEETEEEEEEEDAADEDDMSSTFDIPGFHNLLSEVGNYLNYGRSFELWIDQQEREMITDKDHLSNAEQVMLVINKLARNAVKSESFDDENERRIDLDDVVSVESHDVTTPRSQSSRSTNKQSESKSNVRRFKLTSHLQFKSTKDKRIEKQNQKRKRKRKKKVNAKATIVIKKRFTFTQDLINTIHEASRLTHPVVMSYYDDIKRIDPFEGIDSLKEKVTRILRKDDELTDEYYSYTDSIDIERSKEREKERVIHKAFQLSGAVSPQKVTKAAKKKKDVFAEEFSLSVGGKTPRMNPVSRAKHNTSLHPNTIRSTTAKSTSKSEFLKVENLSFQNDKNRPVTAWSMVKQDVKLNDRTGFNNSDPFLVSSLKVTANKRRKSQATKMTATMRRETPRFSTIRTSECNISEVKETQNKLVKSEVRKVKNPKWIIESDPAISDDDIEFFLFATPFILPPALINKVLDKQQKK